MIYRSDKRKPFDATAWHWHFAVRPVRINARYKAWLCWVERRLVVDDEGNWAGGYKAHWEHRPSMFTV